MLSLCAYDVTWKQSTQGKEAEISGRMYEVFFVLDPPIHIPYINDVIKGRLTTHHNKLASHSNDILQPLVEPQHNRRLRRNWSADLKEN
jgi:hypothetical protein